MIELPNGKQVSPSEVRGLSMFNDMEGVACVRVDLEDGSSVHLEFGSSEASVAWKTEFVATCNAA